MPTRRKVVRALAGLATVFIGNRATLAEGVNDTIVAMGRYLTAVTSLFTRVEQRVDTYETASLDASTRGSLRTEIEALAGALDRLIGPKGIFVQDLQAYLQRARSGAFDSEAQRQREWERIQGEVESIAKTADEVRKMVASPASHLNLVIGDEDRLALEFTMAQRGILLRRFPQVPAPAERGELTALDFLVQQHQQLLTTTRQFRGTLEAKRRSLLA